MTTRGPLLRGALAALVLGASGCVYFNTLYNAERDFARGQKALRDGRAVDAGVAFDSVISRTARILAAHPDSKYADDAALLKARSEVHRERWEAAAASAAAASRLAGDPADRALADGIRGLATLRLGDAEGALPLLDRALAGELPARDRSTFLFVRGRARLLLGDPERAAADLRAAVEEAEASGLDRVELAAALAGVEEYDPAAALLGGILAAPNLVDLTEPQRNLVDTLLARAPAAVERELDAVLEKSSSAAKRSVIHLHRGRARERLGDVDGALADYAAAIDVSALTRAAGEAAYRSARLELAEAGAPGDVAGARGRLEIAVRTSSTLRRDSAAALLQGVELLGGLLDAWESRGSAAAEALLRAAEVARDELRAPGLARGLYLRYLEAVPASPWAVKAVLGALSLAGHSGDGVLGVEDRGAETDDGLRRRLGERPPGDPYLLARARTSSVAAESAYVRSERELAARLAGITRLFRELEAVEDTSETPADTTETPRDTSARRDTARVER